MTAPFCSNCVLLVFTSSKRKLVYLSAWYYRRRKAHIICHELRIDADYHFLKVFFFFFFLKHAFIGYFLEQELLCFLLVAFCSFIFSLVIRFCSLYRHSRRNFVWYVVNFYLRKPPLYAWGVFTHDWLPWSAWLVLVYSKRRFLPNVNHLKAKRTIYAFYLNSLRHAKVFLFVCLFVFCCFYFYLFFCFCLFFIFITLLPFLYHNHADSQ